MPQRARKPGFIEELCIALAHRWEPERLFVIFTGYIDEASSHGAAPRLSMAGLLGNAYEWKRCEKRLADIQARYGFTIFHAKDFKAHKGEFRGWAPDRYPALIRELSDTIKETLKAGVTVVLPRELYLSEYRAPPVPAGMPFDSQYGICFSACFGEMLDIIGNLGSGRHTLHIVIESGHTNVHDCERIFNEVKRDFLERGIDMIGTFTIATKNEAPPLMLGDFLAHTHSLIDNRIQGNEVTYEGLTQGIPNNPKDAYLTFMKFTPGALTRRKERWVQFKEERKERWRLGRDARRASARPS